MKVLLPGGCTYAETNYANPHALTGFFNGTVTTTYTYDSNGNVASTTGAATSTYTWDYRNRMISAWVSGGTSTYAYDHTIARMAQRTSTTTSHYPNKFYSIDYAVNSTTTATSTSYIWHGDTLVAYIEQRIASGQGTGTPCRKIRCYGRIRLVSVALFPKVRHTKRRDNNV
jgi:YD repeat-containing protein